MAMKSFPIGCVGAAACILAALMWAQSGRAAAQTTGAAATFAPAPMGASVTPILQPALENVRRALVQVRVDKWKKGNIREEAGQNIGQIQKDLDASLPSLERAADAAPGTLSLILPVSRNVSAVYDVLLRVVEASRVAAPDDQVMQLQNALVALGDARLKLEDAMLASAGTMEKQASDMRATIRTEEAEKAAASAKPVASQPCTPPAAHRSTRHTARKKTPSHPTTTTPAASTSPK